MQSDSELPVSHEDNREGQENDHACDLIVVRIFADGNWMEFQSPYSGEKCDHLHLTDEVFTQLLEDLRGYFESGTPSGGIYDIDGMLVVLNFEHITYIEY